MPDEAILLRAFGPNLLNAVLLTYEGVSVVDMIDDDGNLEQDLIDHTEKVFEEIQTASERELDAIRRKA